MSIEFYCPGCGQLVGSPEDTAGRKGRCPQCGIKVLIPKHSLTSAGLRPIDPLPTSGSRPLDSQEMPAASPSNEQVSDDSGRWKVKSTNVAGSVDPSTPSSEKIEFICSNCQHRVKIAAIAAGKKGQCPHCKSIVQIPTCSNAPK